MIMDKNNEKLENGFSLYINGPEMTKKTKTGLWPTPTKTLNYQFSSNVCPPFKRDFTETKKTRRFWQIEKKPKENINFAECQTNKDEDQIDFESANKPKITSKIDQIDSASDLCKDIFRQILTLSLREKKLILDALSSNIKKDRGDHPILKIIDGKYHYFDNVPRNPFQSNFEPTFSVKNKTNNFCNETKTFWEKFNDSLMISEKYQIEDSSTDETSEIVESVDLFDVDYLNLRTFKVDLFINILTNWGGDEVGFHKIEVTTELGETAILSKFDVVVQNESKTQKEYFIDQTSILVPFIGSRWTVLVFAKVDLCSPIDQIRIFNYCDAGNSNYGMKNISINNNGKPIFKGDIPNDVSVPFIISCKNK